MDKILKFRVGIEGLEDKIWRVIEITDRMTVADFAYTVLATFNSLAYHLYKITYHGNIYDCRINPTKDTIYDEDKISAVTTKLSNLGLKENDTMEMEYDYGSTTTFKITYFGYEELKNYDDAKNYPYIADGEGLGMLDDMSSDNLKDIVLETDELGYSTSYFTPGYETNKKYDYRKYNIKTDNKNLKGSILLIKNGYEVR